VLERQKVGFVTSMRIQTRQWNWVGWEGRRAITVRAITVHYQLLPTINKSAMCFLAYSVKYTPTS